MKAPNKTPLPAMLGEAMSGFGASAIESWWSELDESGRADVIELWHSVGFNRPCVAHVTSRFIDDDESGQDPELWHNDFYEYLVNHEVYLVDPALPHICTAHETAKRAVEAGLIRARFICPLARDECPMRQLLRTSPGKSIELRIGFHI